MNRVMLALSNAGALVFRNNVGLGWTGALVEHDRATGRVILKNARPVKFGLFKGSGDVIGGVPVEITPDMVGKTVLVFGSWEVKDGSGRPSKDQRHFAQAIAANGGIGVIVRSEDDARQSIKTYEGQ